MDTNIRCLIGDCRSTSLFYDAWCNDKCIASIAGIAVMTRMSFGDAFQATFDARMEAIHEELQQVPNPNEALLQEDKVRTTNIYLVCTLDTYITIKDC
ncbi:hypothetical protein MKX01_032919 [Papaver californicum]|nr:hypothetical protein MKX01_032919 [Papaver californicum]